MGRFAIRRLLSMLLVLFAISLITFLIFEAIPNDPAVRLAGRHATALQIAEVRHKFGFDKPIYIQYLRTMKNIFTNQAYSYNQGYLVNDEIARRFPTTLSLALGAGIFWLLASIAVGTLAAIRAGRYTDRVLTVLAMIGVSLPPFFLGYVFIYFLGFKAHIFPIADYVPLTSNPVQWFVHLVLPWITLSVLFIGFYSRVLRSTILDTINEDFVRTAKAKGLSERQVLARHVLRNSLIPIISLWGLDVAQVVGGGALLTETTYNLQGVGQMAATAIGQLDIIVILVIVMFTAFAVVIFAALMDVVYAYLDPRIRLQ